MQRLEHRACFGGWQDVYRHHAQTLNCEMNVAVYLPPQVSKQRCPVLYWLSGLTCTEQNFITKAGAQRYAAEHGLILARMFHQGRARVGCDAVRWQGEMTLRARAREEEQRSQRTSARLNQVCSARYKLDLALEAKKVSIHVVLRG
jgi:hypothetical protein